MLNAEWTAADELHLKDLKALRGEAQEASKRTLRNIVDPALALALPRMDAGGVPGWPGRNSIADAIVQALVNAGVKPPGGIVGVRLAGFPEAGFEGGEALDAP